MENMKNTLISAGVAVLVVVLGFVFFSPQLPLGVQPGPDQYSFAQFLGGLLRGNQTSTSTTDTATTLIAGDFVNYDTVLVTPNTADLTYTFTASSSLTHFVPATGDRFDQCWFNATTTAGIDLIFAAGTGIDLEVATSTGNSSAFDLSIQPGNMGCITYLRKANTDIVAGLVEYSDAD